MAANGPQTLRSATTVPVRIELSGSQDPGARYEHNWRLRCTYGEVVKYVGLYINMSHGFFFLDFVFN